MRYVMGLFIVLFVAVMVIETFQKPQLYRVTFIDGTTEDYRIKSGLLKNGCLWFDSPNTAGQPDLCGVREYHIINP